MVVGQIPATQWAHVIQEHGKPLVRKQIPVPRPGPGEVLIHIKYSGVCHTDVHAQKGDWDIPSSIPIVGGHEGAGVVVALGEGVTEFEVGDHAGIKYINSVCNKCHMCHNAKEHLCPNATLSGYTVNGSFQEYAIGQATVTTKIPKDVDLAAVSPVMCAGLTVYKALKIADARPGQYVAIVGAAGGCGCFAIQYALAMGLIPFAVDVGPEKGKVCMDVGAAAYVDFKDPKSVIEDLRKATPDGLGPHAAILLASEQEPFTHASEYVRSQGTIVLVGVPPYGWFKSQLWDAISREVVLKGSLVGNREEADEAVEFFRRGLIKVPYQVKPMSALNEQLEALDNLKIVGRVIVDTSK